MSPSMMKANFGYNFPSGPLLRMFASSHSLVTVVEVCTRAIAVVNVAADSGPGRVVVLVAALRRGLDNVEQVGKFTPNPRAGIVLIGDGVDPDLFDESINLAGGPGCAHVQERLRQRVGSAPDTNPHRTRVVAVNRANNRLRSFRHLVGAGRCNPYAGCPVKTRASRSSAVGQPLACRNRLGRTSP